MSECTCKEFPENQAKMWCERHQCWKYKRWHELCKTRENYRIAWDEGRGPGQIPIAKVGTKMPFVQKAKGVGDHMTDLTAELKIKPKKGCGCKGLAREMTKLGPVGCRAGRAALVEKLKKNAEKYTWGDVARAAAAAVTSGLAWKINPLDPYGSMLDEAIRRTELEQGANHADPN